MKLEDQVCSLELAKKLKELGVKQNSLWGWRGSSISACLIKNSDSRLYEHPNHYSAFTVAELGEKLPLEVLIEDRFCKFVTYTSHIKSEKWNIFYGSKKGKYPFRVAIIEADARAKMLVYLLENKLMEVNNEYS